MKLYGSEILCHIEVKKLLQGAFKPYRYVNVKIPAH